MSPILFIALPLLFGFVAPLLSKFGEKSVVYGSVLLQSFLFYLALYLFLNNSFGIESIALESQLGISFLVDKISLLFVILFSFLMLLFSIYYLNQREKLAYKNESKFIILLNMLLASSIGLVLSYDIFNIYVFFEIAGVSAYILSAYQKTPLALEAGLKYLLTGSVASIFLLFAIALVYIYIGSLHLEIISQNFELLPYNIKILISLLFLIGFGFKVEIFPLNFWVSDIYEGSTSLVNALFSSLVVKAYLFVFFHLLYLFLPSGEMGTFLLYLGALSMLVAEVVALKQTNLKRLFAYSSLGQASLIFSTFALQNIYAVQAGIFLVFAHSIAKFIIFLSLSSLFTKYESEDIDIFKKFESPFLKFSITIAMLSLLGIPLLAGFVGKFLALKSFADNEMFILIALLLIASLIEAAYYFKLIGFMFEKNDRAVFAISYTQKAIFLTLVLLLLALGVVPMLVSSLFLDAAQIFLGGA